MALLTATETLMEWMDKLNAHLGGTTAVSSTPYTHLSTDSFVEVDASSASVTVDLIALASASGVPVTFKKTDASANTVTLDANGSDTIDGAGTVVITAQYASVTIQPGSSEWLIK